MRELDKKLIASFTPENVKEEFENLKRSKTDKVSGVIALARGCDKIGHEDFLINIDHHTNIICDKGESGKYCFAPFREKETPKPPFTRNQLKDAKIAGKIRTISISTIQDTIFQKFLANVLCPHAENVFAQNIDLHSYGYREGKSSKMAVKKIRRLIDEGYLYVLDADISKFFDEIDHSLLTSKMRTFFGEENELIQKFLFRFIHVDRIPANRVSEYKYPQRGIKRTQGIPQGGVLSGLLANVFLYDFDLYVTTELIPKYHFEYFRYADDFVLLFKNNDKIQEVYQLLETRLKETEKLVLHSIGEKTKLLDLQKDSLDFLGFAISPKSLRVKNDNFQKFRQRIISTLKDIETDNADEYFSRIIHNVNLKIVGLEDMIEQENGLCLECNRLIKKRSWIGYFMMVNDVRQLRNIDTMIRTELYNDYHRRTKKHLRKKDLLVRTSNGLKSVVKIYYKYKKQCRKYEKYGYCNCDLYYDEDSGKLKTKPKDEAVITNK
ncbi:MAG: reverse transcriptase domain-containing protein [Oscillospiraceae bacterium]|nr:reverse transcriptase domain-containing protein [Oscillospiraceae bacterium]